METKTRSKKDLPALLVQLQGQYTRRCLPEDPVFFVHQYKNPLDQEIVGLLSALLAFGNAKAIQGSVRKVLDFMGPYPSRFVSTFDPGQNRDAWRQLGHRWVRGNDLFLLMQTFRRIFDQHGSLKVFFLGHYKNSSDGIPGMLEGVSNSILSWHAGKKLSRGFQYFFPAPKNGSPCKRLNMFLRWMVRPNDGIDLGLWSEIPPSTLIVPLDTHIYRFGRRFRLSRYRSPSWRFACDVTRFLKTVDPDDPVKYDFAICHHGMLHGW